MVNARRQAVAELMRPSALSLTLLTLALLLPTFCFSAHADQRVDSAKKHLRSNSDSIRADAVMSLAEVDNVNAATLILGLAHDRSWRVRRAVHSALARFRSNAVIEFLLVEASRSGRPQRDVAIARAFGKARHQQAKDLLLQMTGRASWLVQQAAVKALGELGDRSVVATLATIARHKESTLRTLAVDSLGQLGGEEVVDPVIAALNDEAWQVRGAAIAALKKLRVKKSIGPLIDRLAVEKGRLAQDAWTALKAITGFTFALDAEVWQAWWERSKDGFRPPTARRGGPNSSTASGGSSNLGSTKTKQRYAQSQRYYGIPTESKRLLFLLDASQSMAGEVEGVRKKTIAKKTRYSHELLDRDYSSNIKIEIAKEELVDTIAKLDSKTYFNIIVYETGVHNWEKKLVPATSINRSRAIEFVRRQRARGAGLTESSRRGRQRMVEGRTNIYDALERAFKSAGIGVHDRHYRSAVDTIFLLSDGVPTAGKLVNTSEILDEIRRINKLRRVVIHTINIGRNREFLRSLASQSGGEFVDLTPKRSG